MRSSSAVALFLFVCGSALAADSENPGPTFTLHFDGTQSDLGFVSRLDPAVGYRLNRYFSIGVGLPFYMIRPSATAVESLSVRPVNALGNAHLDLTASLENSIISYVPTLTVTAPTGNKSAGLTTGHVTYDFSNYVEHSFGRLTPFGNIGFANTVTDTPYFVRPFTSFGFVTHLEGGATVKLMRMVSVGGAAYGIEPSGQQTVISRLIPRQTGNGNGNGGVGTGQGQGAIHRHGVFQTVTVTTGGAELARDHGVNAWISLAPHSTVDLQVGVSHSVTYSLNTLFFGVGINVGTLASRAIHP